MAICAKKISQIMDGQNGEAKIDIYQRVGCTKLRKERVKLRDGRLTQTLRVLAVKRPDRIRN
eukprot:TRINITY_DN1834_c0_g1_i2.p2 TRINITY_DN1834_c0_g1~~TRINITY_DN1834_c0_g1_i2.p2  ORF type:complete len:62 (-),score=7.86 TRINITY_DN1834_c0_g1_i2:77-262(-)